MFYIICFPRVLFVLIFCLQADKVQFIQHIKDIPAKDARNAEMALFCGQPQDAEGLLLQGGLIFRAIMLNISLYNWDRSVLYYYLCTTSYKDWDSSVTYYY